VADLQAREQERERAREEELARARAAEGEREAQRADETERERAHSAQERERARERMEDFTLRVRGLVEELGALAADVKEGDEGNGDDVREGVGRPIYMYIYIPQVDEKIPTTAHVTGND